MFEVERIYCSDSTGSGVRPFPDLVFEVERIIQSKTIRLIALMVFFGVFVVPSLSFADEQNDQKEAGAAVGATGAGAGAAVGAGTTTGAGAGAAVGATGAAAGAGAAFMGDRHDEGARHPVLADVPARYG